MGAPDAASPLQGNSAEEVEEADVQLSTAGGATGVEEVVASAEPTEQEDLFGADEATTSCRTEPAACAASAAAASLPGSLVVSLEEMERQLHDPSLVARYVVNATKAERAKTRRLPPGMVPPWTFENLNTGPRKDATDETLTANPTSPDAEGKPAALTGNQAGGSSKSSHRVLPEPSSAGERGIPESRSPLASEDTYFDANVPRIERDHRQTDTATTLRRGGAKDVEEPQSPCGRGVRRGSINESIQSRDEDRMGDRCDKPPKRRPKKKDRKRRRSHSRRRKSRRRRRSSKRSDASSSDSDSDDDSSDSTSTSESSRRRKKRRKERKRRRRRRKREDSDSDSDSTRDGTTV
jgi:hypothetical protein